MYHSPKTGAIIASNRLVSPEFEQRFRRMLPKEQNRLGLRKVVICFGDNLTMEEEVTETANWMEMLGLCREVGLSLTLVESYIKSYHKDEGEKGKIQKTKLKGYLDPNPVRKTRRNPVKVEPVTSIKPQIPAKLNLQDQPENMNRVEPTQKQIQERFESLKRQKKGNGFIAQKLNQFAPTVFPRIDPEQIKTYFGIVTPVPKQNRKPENTNQIKDLEKIIEEEKGKAPKQTETYDLAEAINGCKPQILGLLGQLRQARASWNRIGKKMNNQFPKAFPQGTAEEARTVISSLN